VLILRIQNHSNIRVDSLKKEAVMSGQTSSFSAVMKHSEEKLKMEALHKLMQGIERQGEQLVKTKSFEGLNAYKKLIKQFLEEAVQNGLQLQQHQSGQKTFRLVKKVEEKLLELQEDVLNKEQDGIQTLALVGEIKGLLINLYL
jgi:uncharacterized protein